MKWIRRYIELLQAQGIGYLRFGNIVLREYGQIIIPIGPVIQEKPSVPIDEKKLFRELNGKLAWWSYPKENLGNNGWYAVIKTEATELSDYKSANIRNQIKKGLLNNIVKKISSDFLMEHGYSVYKKALEGYGKKECKSEIIYQSELSKYSGFEDIIHFWGIFHNNVLIGYSVVYTYDKKEANISEIRINPGFNKTYPLYALIHSLSTEYLAKNRFQYISDGYRNILHPTNIQELLIQKFGFVKEPLFLELGIRKSFIWAVNLFFMIRFLPVFPITIKSVFKLLTIIKQQKKATDLR